MIYKNSRDKTWKWSSHFTGMCLHDNL